MIRYDELIERLKSDYLELNFQAGKKFMFRAPRTVCFEQNDDFLFLGDKNLDENGLADDDERTSFLQNNDVDDMVESLAEQKYYCLQLLHEVGHAILQHKDYQTDVERLKMEREAWEKARELSEKYGVRYDEEFVEEELDTYRDWLHQRSKCQKCGLTRYQDELGMYHCPSCEEFGV